MGNPNEVNDRATTRNKGPKPNRVKVDFAGQSGNFYKIFSSLKRNSVSSANPVLLTHSPVNTTLS